MPIIEKYEPGMFCWIELATNDAAAAKAFYTSLFGWKANDMPIPDGSVYTMLQVDGHDLGALYENKQHPPNWASYINVTSVDDSAKKAQDLGANLIAPPFDVMDVGRMAVVADPQGGSFCLWQAGRHIGATIRVVYGRGHWLIGGRALERAVAEVQRFLVRNLGGDLLLLYPEQWKEPNDER